MTPATTASDTTREARSPGGTAATGTVYLLHFSVPYRHAGHYTGWTDDLAARLAAHEAGHGARLLAVVKAAGITFTLARTRPGTRADERAIKNAGGARRYCPMCTSRPVNGRWTVPADGTEDQP